MVALGLGTLLPVFLTTAKEVRFSEPPNMGAIEQTFKQGIKGIPTLTQDVFVSSGSTVLPESVRQPLLAQRHQQQCVNAIVFDDYGNLTAHRACGEVITPNNGGNNRPNRNQWHQRRHDGDNRYQRRQDGYENGYREEQQIKPDYLYTIHCLNWHGEKKYYVVRDREGDDFIKNSCKKTWGKTWNPNN